jgi:hypothetical protein
MTGHKHIKMQDGHKKGTKVERRKNRGDEPIQVIIHTWKCHNKVPCISYLKQTKMPFFLTKIEKRKAKQVLSGGLVSVERGMI